MTTSSSTNFSVSASELISSAYELARVKDPDESLNSSQSSVGMSSLNKLIKYYIKRGLPLWAIKKGTINLIQGQESYTCGSGGSAMTERPVRIIEAFYRDSNSNDTPLTIISRQEYWDLGSKSTQGRPNQIYYDPQIDLGVLYVYNTADSTSAGDDIHLIYHRPYEDIDALTNTFDFPQEWYIVLEYNLAVDLALRNGIKQSRIAQLEAKARELFYEADWWDVENTSTQIVPDEN